MKVSYTFHFVSNDEHVRLGQVPKPNITAAIVADRLSDAHRFLADLLEQNVVDVENNFTLISIEPYRAMGS